MSYQFTLLDHELCHCTSKPTGNENDTLKSFMAFDNTSCEPVFRVVVGSRIVVPQQSLPHDDTRVTRIMNLTLIPFVRP